MKNKIILTLNIAYANTKTLTSVIYNICFGEDGKQFGIYKTVIHKQFGVLAHVFPTSKYTDGKNLINAKKKRKKNEVNRNLNLPLYLVMDRTN